MPSSVGSVATQGHAGDLSGKVLRKAQPLDATGPWWYNILGLVHQEPPMGSFLPSGQDIRDVVHLTRCSRSTAVMLVLHYGTYFVQSERVASVYNRFHAWVDAQRGGG